MLEWKLGGIDVSLKVQWIIFGILGFKGSPSEKSDTTAGSKGGILFGSTPYGSTTSLFGHTMYNRIRNSDRSPIRAVKHAALGDLFRAMQYRFSLEYLYLSRTAELTVFIVLTHIREDRIRTLCTFPIMMAIKRLQAWIIILKVEWKDLICLFNTVLAALVIALMSLKPTQLFLAFSHHSWLTVRISFTYYFHRR